MPLRRVAVLSDVHGVLSALRAVLADLDRLGICEIVVAGDVVNFGPTSDAVVDLLRARDARVIRGNHEVELVATYATPAMPPEVAGVRHMPTRWTMEQLGPERRAYLAGLPDFLWLDETTVVAHGSPRHVRDAVTASRTDDELRAAFDGSAARLAFVGHTHRPLVRDVPPLPPALCPPGSPAARTRRFVNVGAVAFNLDGDPRASYAVAERAPGAGPGDWQVTLRRVAYDTEAAVREYDNGYRQALPEYAEVFSRQLRTARSYFGPWLRYCATLPDDEVIPSLRRFLAEHP